MAAIAVEPEVKYKKKLFHRVNEVSRITGLKPYVLRYWETEFPQISPEKDGNDQRRYRQSDIDTILRIKHLLYIEKFTIADAKLEIDDATPAAKTAATRKRAKAKSAPKATKTTTAPKRRARSKKRASSPVSSGGLLGEIANIRSELNDLLAFLS